MKPVELVGAVAAVTRPLRLRRYEAGHLPDPGACVDSLIAVNDRSRPGSVGLRFSDGSSWLACSGVVVQQQGPAHQTVDVTPLVQQAVREMLPALVPAAVPLLPSAGGAGPDAEQVRQLAGHMLQLVDTINDLAARLGDAEARLEFLERSAVARVELKGLA